MAKAVLVMDMPDNCYQCRLWHITSEEGDLCGIDFDTVNPRENERPDWCPLVVLPDRIDTTNDKKYCDMGSYISGMHVGYNNVIDVLEGEEDE